MSSKRTTGGLKEFRDSSVASEELKAKIGKPLINDVPRSAIEEMRADAKRNSFWNRLKRKLFGNRK